jgi:minor extracellular serine protease Vpr
MLALSLLALAFLAGSADSGCVESQPCYTSASIANSAANVAGYYAPNSFLTIYGTNLSYVTGSLGPGDIAGGQLPPDGVIQGTEVLVLLNNTPGYIYYVSPGQVNVLIPEILIPGPVTVQLENRSVYGPPVQITLTAAAPALFQLDATNVLATHGNGPLVTPTSPAQPGEVLVLYATGLGTTSPAPTPGEIPEAAWPLADLIDFQVELNGAAIDPQLIQYAGIAPGFAGLYQINLQLPGDCPSNPQIQIGFGTNLSPVERYLPVQ